MKRRILHFQCSIPDAARTSVSRSHARLLGPTHSTVGCMLNKCSHSTSRNSTEKGSELISKKRDFYPVFQALIESFRKINDHGSERVWEIGRIVLQIGRIHSGRVMTRYLSPYPKYSRMERSESFRTVQPLGLSQLGQVIIYL